MVNKMHLLDLLFVNFPKLFHVAFEVCQFLISLMFYQNGGEFLAVVPPIGTDVSGMRESCFAVLMADFWHWHQSLPLVEMYWPGSRLGTSTHHWKRAVCDRILDKIIHEIEILK